MIQGTFVFVLIEKILKQYLLLLLVQEIQGCMRELGFLRVEGELDGLKESGVQIDLYRDRK